ncbi:PepSY domain-containing protein [Sphaerisporangium perillae]|uniref:PepSY domain-containing protein n=1 Tax=Sphaerisporangium perillae TaxID=2935860 RepID=UPI00200ED48B|nr:PepSY domain-containing protein [Sphaerisporangium perillae]
MRQTTRFAVVSIATVAVLTGGTAVALAAAPVSMSAPSSVSTAATAKTATTGAAAPASAGITRAQAIAIAKRRVPGARVTEVEREWEHGHRTWKVELHKGGREYRVYVSIKTGKIIKFSNRHDDSGHGDDDHGHGHDD